MQNAGQADDTHCSRQTCDGTTLPTPDVTHINQSHDTITELEDSLPPYTEVDENIHIPRHIVTSGHRTSLPPSYSDLFPEAV